MSQSIRRKPGRRPDEVAGMRLAVRHHGRDVRAIEVRGKLVEPREPVENACNVVVQRVASPFGVRTAGPGLAEGLERRPATRPARALMGTPLHARPSTVLRSVESGEFAREERVLALARSVVPSCLRCRRHTGTRRGCTGRRAGRRSNRRQLESARRRARGRRRGAASRRSAYAADQAFEGRARSRPSQGLVSRSSTVMK